MKELDSYITISKISDAIYKEKGSKFLSFVFPVDSEESVNRHLEQLRKKYHDARHHCYAYILGQEGEKFRANDDGEPGHSAGDPILGQIRSRDLKNVLVVVVRYFGGTKLGVSGLINAYRKATSEALDHAGQKEVEITRRVSLKYDYELTSEIMNLVSDLDIVGQQFTDTCTLEIDINTRLLDNFISKLKVLIKQKKAVEFELKG